MCSGGGINSRDIWTLWGPGLYFDRSDTTEGIPQWGDTKRAGSKKWDDGNTVNGDEWNSNLSSVETGFKCSGGTTLSKNIWTAWDFGYNTDITDSTRWTLKWGDGLRAGSEGWDDGNTASGDGCNNDWISIEPDFTCSGGITASKDIWNSWKRGFYPDFSSSMSKKVRWWC